MKIHLLTLMSFQTSMNDFLSWTIKAEIWDKQSIFQGITIQYNIFERTFVCSTKAIWSKIQ